jgi:hypothetical protein
MMDWPTRSGKLLTCLGMLPFLIATILSYSEAGGQLWPILVVFVSTYAALIIAFIAGSQWGVTRHGLNKPSTLILVLSNIATVLAWVGILFPSWVISWTILIVCLWFVLIVDYKLLKLGVWTRGYLKLRLYVTTFVTLCFSLMIYFGRQYFY